MPKDAPGKPLMEWEKKQKEYEIKKARAKALKLRISCTICGESAKLNCPCGTTQCEPGANARERVGGGPTRPGAPSQVLFDGLSTHRLARPRAPEGV